MLSGAYVVGQSKCYLPCHNSGMRGDIFLSIQEAKNAIITDRGIRGEMTAAGATRQSCTGRYHIPVPRKPELEIRKCPSGNSPGVSLFQSPGRLLRHESRSYGGASGTFRGSSYKFQKHRKDFERSRHSSFPRERPPGDMTSPERKKSRSMLRDSSL